MKKTIILILILLPIVLLVTISIAGQIRNIFQPVPVERVEFVDRVGNAYTDKFSVELAWGTSKDTAIKIYPENASNQKVTYRSEEPSICSVDENGMLTGNHYGSTVIYVMTEDGNKTAQLNVVVSADIPVGIKFTKEEMYSLSLKTGGQYTLAVEVEAPVAVNKAVYYSSSNEEVATVNNDGVVTAVGPGETIISATTVLGGRTVSTTVTVEEGKPPLLFELDGIPGVTESQGIYVLDGVTTIDLLAHLHTDEHIAPEDVQFSIVTGSKAATLENGILTVDPELARNLTIKIRAYIGLKESPEVMTEVKFTVAVPTP